MTSGDRLSELRALADVHDGLAMVIEKPEMRALLQRLDEADKDVDRWKAVAGDLSTAVAKQDDLVRHLRTFHRCEDHPDDDVCSALRALGGEPK